MYPRSLTLTVSFLLLSLLSTFAAVPNNWTAGSYDVGSLVIHEGTTYIASQAVTPSEGNPTAATAYWSSLDALAGTKSTPTGQPTSTPDTSTLTGLDVPSDTNGTGGTDTGVASGLSTATNEQFVKQQYLDFLEREADSTGLLNWTNALNNGINSRADLVNDFVSSTEFQNRIAPVARLYSAYFLRLPDTGGLTNWINYKVYGNAANGNVPATLEDISQQFADSAEFNLRYGSLNDTEFVTLVYQNVLKRDPDPVGLSNWVQFLTEGSKTRGGVMIGFSESTEYKDAVDVDIRVISLYYGMLRRAPDPDGFNNWSSYIKSGVSATVLVEAFLDEQEYTNRF